MLALLLAWTQNQATEIKDLRNEINMLQVQMADARVAAAGIERTLIYVNGVLARIEDATVDERPTRRR
jgi:hypothetical protein